jgi:hypothetical protein
VAPVERINMSFFKKFRKHLNSLECGSKITYEDLYDKLIGRDNYDSRSSELLKIYLAGFSKTGIIEPKEDLSEYIVKNKVAEDLTLYDFLEVVEGGSFKEWFIQVCEK